MYTQIQHQLKLPTLYSRHTKWESFKQNLDELINLDVSLKSKEDIDKTVWELTKTTQEAAWQSTPDVHTIQIKNPCPVIVKEKIGEKRKLQKLPRVVGL